MEVAIGPYLYAMPSELRTHIFSFVHRLRTIKNLSGINPVFLALLEHSVYTIVSSRPLSWKNIRHFRGLRVVKQMIRTKGMKEMEDIGSRDWIHLEVSLDIFDRYKLHNKHYHNLKRWIDLISDMSQLKVIKTWFCYGDHSEMVLYIRNGILESLGLNDLKRSTPKRYEEIVAALSELPFTAVMVYISIIHSVIFDVVNMGRVKRIIFPAAFTEEALKLTSETLRVSKSIVELEFRDAVLLDRIASSVGSGLHFRPEASSRKGENVIYPREVFASLYPSLGW